MLRNDGGDAARASWGERLRRWVMSVAPWWAASICAHMAIFIVLALVLGTVHVVRTLNQDRTTIETALVLPPDEVALEHFKVLPDEFLQPEKIDLDVAPTQITDISPPENLPPGGNDLPASIGQVALVNGDPETILAKLKGGIGGNFGGSAGHRDTGGYGGNRDAIGNRLTGGRGPGKGGATDGRTDKTDAAVVFALDWIARHQDKRDGHWSLDYSSCCKDATCTAAGRVRSDTAATAFGMLPFLGAGQRHDQRCKYQREVAGGLSWLIRQQAPDGNLAAGSSQPMYAHGLASICLCEAYGMTHDPKVGDAARAAIRFIESAQNLDDGGWRYRPGDPGDTSVFGWQLMALKSAEMAGLAVNPSVLVLTKKYLESASRGKHGGLYGYMPGQPGSPAMTAVGMLCSQYSGAKREDPATQEGMQFLLGALPTKGPRDGYFWYYASQAMHNMSGPEWDTWNRAMRRVLVESQVREGCAAGSWDPTKPSRDRWGEEGGRLMVTSLATLTLEVYYRYLPLYQLDKVAKNQD